MTEKPEPITNRRRFLRLVGAGTVLVPLVGLQGCGTKDAAVPAPPAAPAAPPAPTSAVQPEPAPLAPPATAEPAAAAESVPAAAPAGALPRLEESDTVAKALGYRHDTIKVDQSRYAQHKPGQACRNCIQFKGAATDSWGPCAIFPGKQVNANGWCITFAARP